MPRPKRAWLGDAPLRDGRPKARSSTQRLLKTCLCWCYNQRIEDTRKFRALNKERMTNLGKLLEPLLKSPLVYERLGAKMEAERERFYAPRRNLT